MNIAPTVSGKLIAALLLAACAVLPGAAGAERLKDLASIQGVRQNQLIGYGLVVGLDGSGDQTTQTPRESATECECYTGTRRMITMIAVFVVCGLGNGDMVKIEDFSDCRLSPNVNKC